DIEVRIFDKRSGPVEHSNALVLHVRSLEVLEAMGIADRFVEQSFPLEYLSLNAFGRHLGGLSLYGIDGPYSGPRTIGQDKIERLLVARLAELGVAVEWQHEMSELHADDDGVTLTCSTPRGENVESRCEYVIGADGGHSSVRDASGIAVSGERYEG